MGLWGDVFKKAILGDTVNEMLESNKKSQALIDEFKRSYVARQAGEDKIFQLFQAGLTHKFGEFEGPFKERVLEPLEPHIDDLKVALPFGVLLLMIGEGRGPENDGEVAALRQAIGMVSEIQMGVWGSESYEQLKRAHFPA